jgi:hypothetical protein
MRSALRLGFALVVLIHGALHLMGTAKGFGWAEVDALDEPIGTVSGVGWLSAAALVIAAGVLVLARVHWAWIVLGAAAVASEAAIITSWSDAWAGTAANVLVLIGAVHGFVAHGPRSLRTQYRRLAAAATSTGPTSPTEPVTEADLERLPSPLAAYLRASGVVGKPRVTSFRATIHGRIRGGPDEPWMRFTGEQVNTFGEQPERLFLIDATRRGLPIDVLHAFTDHATMRARLCSAVPIVDGAGPELDRAETVTLFNDMCLLAPAALLDADVTWEEIEDRRVRGTFRRGSEQITADLVFDYDHALVDFESGDRLRSSADGRTFTPTRWSTPVQEYADFGGRRVVARGDAVWHPKPPEGQFAYLELVVDTIAYDHDRPVRPTHAELVA